MGAVRLCFDAQEKTISSTWAYALAANREPLFLPKDQAMVLF